MDTSIFEKQLESILNTYEAISKSSTFNDLSDLSRAVRQNIVTRAVAAIKRVSGENSSYSKDVDRIIKNTPSLQHHLTSIIGVAFALHDDIKAGYLKNLEELVHGEVFADFLEQASYLVNKGFKDAAAVLAGSTLESHLKKLAIKSRIVIIDAKGPLKASKINDELARVRAYSTLDQKNITSWLGLRNESAHGNYSMYNEEQVSLMIQSVRDFISRTPA